MSPYSQQTAKVAAAVAHPAHMHPGPESLGAPPSFTARRPNASNLQGFELPPPQLPNSGKYPYAQVNGGANPNQPSSSLTSVGNLLTPPSNLPGDGLSPVSTGVSSTAPGATHNIQHYAQNGYVWPPQQQQQQQQQQQSGAPYGFQSSAAPSQSFGPARGGLFSPSLNLARGQPNSHNPGEGLPQQHYEASLPPFSGSMSAPQQPAMSAPHHQQPLSSSMMAPHTVTSGPQPSPVHAQDGFRAPQPPPTPSYYPPSGAPQQQSYPYSAGPSPTQASPVNSGPPRMSPAHSSGPIPQLPSAPSQSPHHYQRQFGYPMPGPVLSNINNPTGGLTLVNGIHGGFGGFNSGHAANMQHVYGAHAQQPQPMNDRPFKCDQCPQSFNRNHDLKRHKRIHLAVKPFPCGHCDKSFSRKDALKVRFAAPCIILER